MKTSELEAAGKERAARASAERYCEPDPMLSPEERLAHAIILQAVREYRHVLRRLRVRPESGVARRSREELESFFFSPLFRSLTGLSPCYLVNRLLKEAGMEALPRTENRLAPGQRPVARLQ